MKTIMEKPNTENIIVEELKSYIMEVATLNDNEYVDHHLAKEKLILMIVNEETEERSALFHYNQKTEVGTVTEQAFEYLSKRAAKEVDKQLSEIG